MRRLRPLLLALGILLATLTSTGPAAANFVADLSDRLIAITTAFSGTEVLLYGAVQDPGSEIAVIVRGPVQDVAVRRKSRVGPIWINTEEATYRNVPAFFAVAASEPLEELGDPATLARHELGVDHLRLQPQEADQLTTEEAASYREALIRNKQQAGLFIRTPGTVNFLGGTLFRTRIFFPTNVPPGIYQVQVLQFSDGYVTGAQTSTLEISKMGIEAELYDIAMQRPSLYGLAAILLALAAGWSANAMFRRA